MSPMSTLKSLRQFVDRRLADEAAHLGDARIVLQLLRRVPFRPGRGMFLQVCVELRISVVDHGSKLQDAELAAVPSDPLLRIERVVAVPGHDKGSDDENGEPEIDGSNHEQDVDETFEPQPVGQPAQGRRAGRHGNRPDIRKCLPVGKVVFRKSHLQAYPAKTAI
jgi:hypothetical protein